MKVILLHPTGNRNVRAVMEGLASAGMLAEFNTTLSADPAASWLKLMPKGMSQEWLRRTFPVPADQIWTSPLLEIARIALPKLGWRSCAEHEHGWASLDAVYHQLDRAAARRLPRLAQKRKANAVYAYEDGALATFTQAKQLGMTCVYDLPIAFWETTRRLLTEEAERLPGWAPTLGGGILDSPAKLERKTRELELADVVVGPGQFVLNSLPPWAKGKQLVMAPFGSPRKLDPMEANESAEKGKSNRPLRVLFAGAMGQRKGLGDLFAAVRLLNRSDIELVVMGSLLAPMEFYHEALPNFTHEPGRSNEQVLALMRSCDVFCLPSIVEGRALVMQEAMSQGLPLIITPNTGGADLIQEGKTGFLVPIRSPEAIANKLTWFLENRAQIPEMGRNAQEHAASYTWENYGAQIVESLSS
ncbi:glycosyltransferase family 4 protein [Hymenobacter crusticola]|uniref:Group 1 glycosyl transferase n=1 Tax=Hymenobacter crusticola TaxID=1770526 RepID=A0A243W8D9_9BACT|nr:glycosyltransferase [Hymenobacter crusticola]OUJ71202.1 group 1 glycosyl transferase [Hymenobacter crusticola]